MFFRFTLNSEIESIEDQQIAESNFKFSDFLDYREA